MKNLVLIGFMGCGKSTIGIKLSYKLRRALEDTDKYIEKQQGKAISDIFRESGEAAFRQMETDCIKELTALSGKRIVSTGGGMPIKEENRPLLKQLGTVVYLRVTPETVYERLKGDTTRPLLQGDDPMSRIRNLLEARKDIYESAADIIVDVDGKNTEDIVAEICKKAEAFEKGKIPMKILVMNGPNLNFLGIREKKIYGNQDYDYLLQMIAKKGEECNCTIEVFQSNHEGALIDRIQDAYFDGTDAIVINPGAFTHYSYAIHDALASVSMPKIEIHISDITRREDFRKVSVTRPACDDQIFGHGLEGYLMAIDKAIELVEKKC